MTARSSKQIVMASRSESAGSAPDLKALRRGIGAGERAVVARGITLIESKRPDHQKAARAVGTIAIMPCKLSTSRLRRWPADAGRDDCRSAELSGD
jgi:hypothetical protein